MNKYREFEDRNYNINNFLVQYISAALLVFWGAILVVSYGFSLDTVLIGFIVTSVIGLFITAIAYYYSYRKLRKANNNDTE